MTSGQKLSNASFYRKLPLRYPCSEIRLANTKLKLWRREGLVLLKKKANLSRKKENWTAHFKNQKLWVRT